MGIEEKTAETTRLGAVLPFYYSIGNSYVLARVREVNLASELVRFVNCGAIYFFDRPYSRYNCSRYAGSDKARFISSALPDSVSF